MKNMRKTQSNQQARNKLNIGQYDVQYLETAQSDLGMLTFDFWHMLAYSLLKDKY